ncbi:MAG: hypothetical protein WDO74_28585 [Pseudomonadota bacterium]
MRHSKVWWMTLPAAAALTTAIGCSDEPAPGGNNGGSTATAGAANGNAGAPAIGGATSGGAGTTSGGSSSGGSSTAGAANGGASGGGAGGSAAGAGGASTAGAGGAAGGSTAGAGGASTAGAGGGAGGGGSAHAMMNFFVTSDTKSNGNLGGLSGADARCQTLAAAVGQGNKTWRAYLSIGTPATNARDRIGPGPYYNSKGEQLAADKDALHARSGDAALFLDEKGNRINGQWANSPTPNQHDILTGTQKDGTIAASQTCGDWTATTGMSQVGHSDGLGPNMAATSNFVNWTGSHTGQCGDTAPGGGAGKIYCFVGPLKD